MNQLIFCSFHLLFFIFSKENIVYQDDRSECKNIEEIIQDKSLIKTSDYPANMEFCSRHNSQLKEKKCCNTTIFYSDGSKVFCGKVDSNLNDEEIQNYIQKLKTDNKNLFENIIIDCFSKKLDFMMIILIIYLICLI